MLHPVILSGGSGTRLWPVSQPQLPKQFLPLTSERSVLQETILRLNKLPDMAAPTFVCNQVHQHLILTQLAEIHSPARSILVEPCPRNTAPAITLAALDALRDDPEAMLIIMPSDHMIQDEANFGMVIRQGVAAAQAGYLVTFGITPDKPHTGYGYIHQGEAVSGLDSVFHVMEFVEKPGLEKATEYLNAGTYSWNSGIFLFSATSFLEELRQYNPKMLAACEKAFTRSRYVDNICLVDEASFSESPSDSIDYAVMEKTGKAVMIAAKMGWNDIGTWNSLWEVSSKDSEGNAVKGRVFLKNAKNCYVNSGKDFVAILGVDDLIVIETENALLITHKKSEQDVKEVVQHLQSTPQ